MRCGARCSTLVLHTFIPLIYRSKASAVVPGARAAVRMPDGCRPADARRARAGDNTFVCTRSYCRKSGEFGEPPAELRPAAAPLAGKGKGKAATAAPVPEAVEAGAACAPAPCLTA